MRTEKAGDTRQETESRHSSSGDRQAARFAVILALLLIPLSAVAQNGPPAGDPANVTDASELEYYEPTVVKDAARDVLDSPEFRNLPRLDLGPEGKKAEPLKSKEEEKKEQRVQVRSSGGGGLLSDLFGGVVSLSVVLILAVVIGAIVALVVLGLRHWERTEKDGDKPNGDATSEDEPEPLVTPGERPADAWLAAARASASAGRFDEALCDLLLGAMSHAERAGLIRPRRGLTYRDYLRAVPESSAWHGTLDRLIRSYAPVGFGRRPGTAAAFEAVVTPYEAALFAEPPPSSSLAEEKGRE